jgi:hypothetical protein
MATPNPRTNILLGRGTKANLTASLADILEGEIVFATDENLTYVKSGGSLVASSVSSVNSQSGVVVLDADDIDDTSTTNKFATAAQLAAADSATQPGDNVSTLTNDANYIDAAGAPVQSVAGKTGAVSLVKGDVGLGNVDNTSDANKPISTATQSALNLKADLVGGVVPNSQLPSLAITEYLGTVANQTALLALTGQRGDWAIRTDTGSTWVLTTDGGSTITDWTELATPADAVASVNGFTGTVVLGPGDVGAATAAQGALADSATQPGDNISTLTNDAGYITSAGAPGTDLTYTASTRVLASSTGTDATLPEVVAAGDSGLMTGADKTKLDGIATGATNVTNNNQLTNGAGYITSADGGDAATLDGLDSTQFLRSDATDTFSGINLTFDDSSFLRFGDSGDLRLFHNGTNSFIDQTGVGQLYIRNNVDDKDIIIQTDDGTGSVTNYFLADGSTGEALLYHYGDEKLATKAAGIGVYGDIGVTGLVDGRNVADDGAKLDGIATGAEVNTVDSVNTQTGAVVLDADDIDDTSTTHKFATAAQLANADSALQSGDNISTLTNDAGYITATVTGDFTVDTSTLKVDSTNNRVGVGQATPIVDLDVDGAYAGSITAVGALDIDCSTANYFTKTISANSTFTFSSAPSSRAYGFTLELTHTSGTITWPTSVKWPGDTAPTLSTGKTHLFTFVTDDGGTRWRGAASVDYVN